MSSKLRISALLLALVAGVSLGAANTVRADDDYSSYPAFEGCTEITRKVGIKQSGRFGWKPKAAHFNAAVIVGARRFVNDPAGVPIVTLYKASNGQRMLSSSNGLRLKSKGRCNGVGEDLCADTWKTPNRWPGSRVAERYGAIIVRFKGRSGSTRGCRYYYVANPAERVQYENK